VQSKLPKLIAKNSLGYDNYVNGLIFSLKPQYAKQIIYGNKRVELRRKFNSSYVNRKVYLYATSPQKQIVGTARIQSIVKDKPDRIWETFKDLIGCDKNEFDSYSNNCAQISAIQLTEVSALDAPFGLTFLESVSQTNLTPPQSYFQINSNENWLKAISIYELTRKNFCAYHI
jgi:predicted transcriptional regulator